MNESQPEDDLSPVANALYRGQKIEAIKLYRESHNCGLKEAKDAVEELEAGLRKVSPEKFAQSAGKGCLGVAAFLMVAVLLALTLTPPWKVAK